MSSETDTILFLSVRITDTVLFLSVRNTDTIVGPVKKERISFHRPYFLRKYKNCLEINLIFDNLISDNLRIM